MSRESKFFTVTDKKEVSQLVKEYECFGWELLSLNGLDVVMTRETQNSVYPELVKNEYEYETLREELAKLQDPEKPDPLNIATTLVLLILFILPGVIYISRHSNNMRKYQKELERITSERERILEEIRQICNKSRVTFFSRQQQQF